MFYRHSVGSYEKSCRGMPFVSDRIFNVTETEISEVEEEIEIQDITGIFDVLFSS